MNAVTARMRRPVAKRAKRKATASAEAVPPP
jgi:hypothetical protein